VPFMQRVDLDSPDYDLQRYAAKPVPSNESQTAMDSCCGKHS
jgi:hypothetical protein